MKNNNRLYYLFSAGTLTVLLFATIMLFNGNFPGVVADAATNGENGTTILNRAGEAGPAPDNETIENTPIPSVLQATSTPDATLTTLQAQNAKLIQMVQTMQERERQYQAQLQAANQALQTAQAAPAEQNYGGSEGAESSENEQAEHGETEHGETEHGETEHGGYEQAEHDEHEGFGEDD